MQSPAEFYQDQIHALTRTSDLLSQKSLRVAWSRGGLALLAVFSAFGIFSIDRYLVFPALFLAAVFIVLVKQSEVIKRELRVVSKILELNRHEAALIRGDKSVFDQGADVNIRDHLYALDLDVFGKGSLFQSVNRTVTKEGRRALIKNLLYPAHHPDEITLRGQAVDELATMVQWRQEFFGAGALSDEPENNTGDMVSWVESRGFFADRAPWLWVAGVMSATMAAFLVWMIATATFYPPVLLLLVINSALMFWLGKPVREYFVLFGKRTEYFSKFARLFKLVEASPFQSALAADIRQKAHAASGAFEKIAALANVADQRLGLLGPVLNSLYYFDLWNIRRIEKWRMQHRHQIDGWLAALAEIDMLNSFANFSFNHPSFTRATIDPSVNQVTATDVGHPLIPEGESVKNTYAIGRLTRGHIITGSNMAGKSTFIRGIALNVLLAMNGVPVCAGKFSCSVLRLVSCIRITDSLEENASYFKAELARLDTILQILKEGKPCLVLLDEILRGTNSDDKRFGTMAFYKKIVQYNCLALLATHDLAVGHLEQEDPQCFENFCFESSVVNGELAFDYHLRRGISASTNASFLMRKMGLID